MSASYNPSPSASLQQPWTSIFLSNRDLSDQIPINFVTHPGISVTPACFGDGIYDPITAESCISDLLSIQFRRLIFDLYWDPSVRQYNLCPVAIPTRSNYVTSTSNPSQLNASAVAAREPITYEPLGADLRQGLDSNSTLTPTSSTHSFSRTSSTSTTFSPAATVMSATGEILLQLGHYQCSQSLNLAWVVSLLQDYCASTGTELEATLVFIELNLHAAALSNTPDEPADAVVDSSLPRLYELVGSMFRDTITDSLLYTPKQLQADRSDLNNSWFSAPDARYPIAEYFQTDVMSDGDLSTTDGWPGENYLLVSKAARILLNWGTVDPQMGAYNFQGDSSTLFASRQVIQSTQIDSNAAGDLVMGCFYDDESTDTAHVNSSWARTVQNQEFPSLTHNVTSCGISPILNITLSGSSANISLSPYQTFVHASIWSWANGEPRNKSVPGTDMDDPQSQFRCAIMDPTSAYKGHWRVEDCQLHNRVACRVRNQPYIWILSEDRVPYGSGLDACPGNATFSVPRTGLENTYLYHRTIADAEMNGVWLNFNSLDVEACWTDQGPNATCPYFEDHYALQQRTILVPTIGALIVLILTALTVFVKCNVNRRNSKVRRRGEGGWDYEGVPS